MNTQMITKLILRDLKVYRMRIVGISFICLVLGMFMIFINTHLDRMFAGSCSFIFITIIVPFLLELKNKSVWIHTASLPVSRKAMVISRFLVSLFIVSINLIIWIIVFNGLMEILQADPKYALSNDLVLIVWMNLLFNLALFYFVYYRFSFMAAMGIYLLSTIFPQLIQTILYRTSGFAIEDFDQPLGLSIVAISLFMLAFYFSLTHFPKRDL